MNRRVGPSSVEVALYSWRRMEGFGEEEWKWDAFNAQTGTQSVILAAHERQSTTYKRSKRKKKGDKHLSIVRQYSRDSDLTTWGRCSAAALDSLCVRVTPCGVFILRPRKVQYANVPALHSSDVKCSSKLPDQFRCSGDDRKSPAGHFLPRRESSVFAKGEAGSVPGFKVWLFSSDSMSW